MAPTHTALIIPVPETEPVVGEFRSRFDRAASWGVPAHVTVLYPFLPPAEVTGEVLAALGEIFAGIPAFEAAFERSGWFGDTVLWLDPCPGRRFRELTDAVWRRFPQAPPYEGAFEDVVPHLTVGHDVGRDELLRAEAAVAAALPIRAAIRSVRLIAGSPEPDGWGTIVADFPLGPPTGATSRY
jgi:2'-5' RNA ligase